MPSPSPTHVAAVLPPLLSLPDFFKTFGVSKSLYYKLGPDRRPRTVRVGSKPMIRAEDALEWAARLPDAYPEHNQDRRAGGREAY